VMSRMPPTESSDLHCLNREEGETISLDYQDLYGVQVMHKLSSEVFRSFSFGYSDLVSYGGGQTDYGVDGGIYRVEDTSLSNIDGVHDGDNNHYADVKEYTDLSNKAVIKHSLEFIRTAIEVNTIPTVNREIIEQSICNLQAAVDISNEIASDKVIPTQVNTNQSVTEAATNSYLLPPCDRTGYRLRQGPRSEDSGRDEDRRCSVIKATGNVSSMSVEEARVREALGLTFKVRKLYL
jgi:hypothetical protein